MEPRLEPEEIEFFKNLLEKKEPGTKMVEWGSGGSTLLFLPYFGTGELISVEHNKEWVDKVAQEVTRKEFSPEVLKGFTYCWRPPHYNGAHVQLGFHGYGVPYEECPTFVADYIDPEYSDPRVVKVWDSDIYFVDGIARGPVLATIKQRALKKEARVFLHDLPGPENRREWYEWALRLYSKVEQVGPTLSELTL